MSDTRGTGERTGWTGAVVALMTEPDIKSAAKRVGRSERTLRRWLAQPGFLALLGEARRVVLAAATAKLQSLTEQAVEVLRKSMASDSPGVALKAANTVLERAAAAAELADVLSQVDGLRRKLEELRSREADRAKA